MISYVQNGDKVVYSKYAGTELRFQGADFVLLKVWYTTVKAYLFFVVPNDILQHASRKVFLTPRTINVSLMHH